MGFSLFSNKGVLGINARNLLYIKPYNAKKAIKLADDKIKTKQFLSARDIPVPKLYGIIRNNEELEKFDFSTLNSSFVIKPNHGYGGEGIIPIVKLEGNEYLTAAGKKITKQEIKEHIRDILDGRYSISNISDYAFFEQYIVSDEKLAKFSYSGLPDVRIVVHNLIPVMSMLRLPTKESEGKANLHLGAVGVGIDIAKGETTHATYKNKIIEELPNEKGLIRGIKIPYWDEILLIASKVQLITNLGYMAVDISIDKNSGPVLLEINARAGLAVQIANLAPLKRRLERIQGIKVTTPTKGVRVAKDLFGNMVEKEIKQISGKVIIGTEENVEIMGGKKGAIKLKARITPHDEKSSIDFATALKHDLLSENEYNQAKSSLKIKFLLGKQRIQTVVNLKTITDPDFKMIIGRRDLKNFLIDTNISHDNMVKSKLISTAETTKSPTQEIKNQINHLKNTEFNYRQIDLQLNYIDQRIKMLYHLKPLNLEVQKKIFYENQCRKNPIFEYPQLKFDPLELIDELAKLELDNSLLGQLFAAKKSEIFQKIALIEAIDEENFTTNSIALYGQPLNEEIEECEKWLKGSQQNPINEAKIAYHNCQYARAKFEEKLEQYGLKNWKVKIKDNIVAACVAGKNNRLFVRENAHFSDKRIKSLIIHEIETHILTAENGKYQDYQIFQRGTGNYLETQEGLAIYNVACQSGEGIRDQHMALAHVIAIDQAIQGSFRDVYAKLISLGLPSKIAFKSAVKVKRGISDTGKAGAFTKDMMYYRGYKQVKKYIDDGGKLADLYYGKFNLKDLELIKKIGVKEAKYLPFWLKK